MSNSSTFKNEADRIRFADQVMQHIGEFYTYEFSGRGAKAGDKFQGQAVSFLIQCMRIDHNWKNLGSLSNFESICEEAGFRIVTGRNRRGGKARVVTI